MSQAIPSLIESFEKCLIDMGPSFGCINIGTTFLVLMIGGILFIVINFLIPKTSKSQTFMPNTQLNHEGENNNSA
jgi:hypothetical protein